MSRPPKTNPHGKPSTFTLLLAVRDSQSTRGSARALLEALVLRAAPKNANACWPSYRQLAEDTMLDEATLKRAAKTLEDAGLIRRLVRRQRSTNSSSVTACLWSRLRPNAKLAWPPKTKLTASSWRRTIWT